MFLSEELKTLAPSAFRSKEDGAEAGASKHYQFMTSNEVIDGLVGMGWNVFDAKQQKSKKNPETTKHMLRFRNENFGSLGVNGNVVFFSEELAQIYYQQSVISGIEIAKEHHDIFIDRDNKTTWNDKDKATYFDENDTKTEAFFGYSDVYSTIVLGKVE